MRTIRGFFRRVKRVIDFLPIIWKGRDFDYHYAVELFKYQLERMADFFESDNACSIESRIQARRIRTVIRLIDKVYNEEYSSQYIEQIQKLFGEEKFELVKVDDDKCKGCYTYKITHENAIDEKHQEEILKMRDEMFRIGYERQERAHRLLWKLIEHEIRRWWD